MKSRILWILTEERPKIEVLEMILSRFAKDYHISFLSSNLRILPLKGEDGCFSFVYEVRDFICNKIDKIYIKTVSGSTSFADFLVYCQDNEPAATDEPAYIIEETKTDDKESRNTGVYQRSSKFIVANHYYPNAQKVMLYALQVKQKEKPTDTYIFGTRLLLTLGVDIIGKELDSSIFVPFESIDDVIKTKADMRKAHKNNVPINISKSRDTIYISGRLCKKGRLTHDPNIGALTTIAAVLRHLGWTKNIVITEHGLCQTAVGKKNKFVLLANILNISLKGLSVPQAECPAHYWHYETKGEKLGTIFIHIAVESFTDGYSIFENHAGCEKSYFQTSEGKRIPLAKYADPDKYKAGDKSQIIYIPDLVLIDVADKQVVTIEGKKYCNKEKGIKELQNYDSFDDKYLRPFYPLHTIVRTVVLFGGNMEEIVEVEVGFLLNAKGRLVLGIKAPSLFTRAISRLRDFWGE